MDPDEVNFAQHLSVLNRFKSDPAFQKYWTNWNKCQNWTKNCEDVYNEYEVSVAWQRAQNHINLLLNDLETAEAEAGEGDIDKTAVKTVELEDIVMDESGDQMSEFYRISMEHRLQRQAERDRQDEEDLKKPKVEYIDAKDLGIHGVSSFTIEKKTFGERSKAHLADMQEKYGPHAEKIITMESSKNYKFDELIAKHAPPLWPNIPFKF